MPRDHRVVSTDVDFLPHSTHRRRWTIVVTALVCLLIADGFVRRGEEAIRAYHVNSFSRKLNKLSSLSPAPEVLLLGSSRAQYGLVPEEFERLTGRRSFNLGIAASGVIEWEMLARAACERVQPRLVVLSINAAQLDGECLPTLAARHLFEFDDLVAYCKSDGWSTKVVGGYLRRHVGPAWALYHQREEIKLLVEEQVGFMLPKYAQRAVERRIMVAKPCPDDGYEHPWLYGRQLRNLHAQLEEEDGDVWALKVPARSERSALPHFDHFLAWFGARQIPLVVAYLPNSPRTERRWAAVEPETMAALAAICDRRGVPFVTCWPEEVPRTNRDFLHDTHVGLPLARRLSRRVAERVLAMGWLDDSRPRFAGAVSADMEEP